MEKKLKHRISRIFQITLTSCRTKNISDVIKQPFFPENQQHLFSPKTQPFSSLICKPKLPQTQHTYEKRPKVSDRNTLLLVLNSPVKEKTGNCRKYPPFSPTTTPNHHRNKPKKGRRRHKSRSRKTNRKSEFFSLITAKYYASSWYNSDDEDDNCHDETTLFSSRSLSSDSSGSFRKHKGRLADIRSGKNKGEANGYDNGKAGGVVADSFAVVKKSSDPHYDFRISMVEMIIEKQIFGAQELEDLLECFLWLNSDEHHVVIVQVFTEILDTLFSDSY